MKSIVNNQRAFTLIETIIYIAITSVFFVTAIGFFWQMKEADSRSVSARELKENSAQVMESFKYFIRNADDIDFGASVLESDDGKLELSYSGGNKYFEVYPKQIEIGGKTYEIKKLRINSGGDNHDLTSDHVSVDKFYIDNVTYPGAPKSVRIQLELSVPGVSLDKKYYEFMEGKITAGVRKEV